MAIRAFEGVDLGDSTKWERNGTIKSEQRYQVAACIPGILNGANPAGQLDLYDVNPGHVKVIFVSCRL
jgi:hypothetical protein